MDQLPDELKCAGPIAATCFQIASQTLQGRRDYQSEDGFYHLSKDQMLMLLTRSAVHGFEAGMKETKQAAGVDHPNAHQGASVVHGKRIRIITTQGESVDPGNKGWLQRIRDTLF